MCPCALSPPLPYRRGRARFGTSTSYFELAGGFKLPLSACARVSVGRSVCLSICFPSSSHPAFLTHKSSPFCFVPSHLPLFAGDSDASSHPNWHYSYIIHLPHLSVSFINLLNHAIHPYDHPCLRRFLRPHCEQTSDSTVGVYIHFIFCRVHPLTLHSQPWALNPYV